MLAAAVLPEAFAIAAERGYTHVILVQDRGSVPHHARVDRWQLCPAEAASPNRREMIALYNIKDATAPRVCQNPRLLKALSADFAAALAHLGDVPPGKPGVAVIVASPFIAQQG